MSKTKIQTGNGHVVSGEEVRREEGHWGYDNLVHAVGTLGFSEVVARDTTRVTVKDAKGCYWTGKPKS